MMRALLTFLLFIGMLALIGYGVLWYVDNKENLKSYEEDLSIKSIMEESRGLELSDSSSIKKEEEMDVSTQTEKEDKNSLEENKKIDTNISILVLNGGAEKGAAGSMQVYLQNREYAQVEAANAKSFTYRGITLYYQDKELAKQVESILEEKYGEIDKEEAETSGQKVADIVIVIGQ